jgi:hypothetical protein
MQEESIVIKVTISELEFLSSEFLDISNIDNCSDTEETIIMCWTRRIYYYP